MRIEIEHNVRRVLESAEQFKWSLQGFGMLRCYLDERVRLHVWDDRHAVPGVSVIHDHPWDFTSSVISGRLENIVYEPVYAGDESPYDPVELAYMAPHMMQYIRCGEGGGPLGEPKECRLRVVSREIFEAGRRTYEMKAPWLHESKPEPGTVSLIVRDFVAEDRDHATVCFPKGEEWVSAEPRPATDAEVRAITGYALSVWRTE